MTKKSNTSRRAPQEVRLGGASKEVTLRGKPSATKGILLRYCDTNTPYGVTRETVIRLARKLRLTEAQVIHAALANFVRHNLPHFEADAGPLTAEQKEAIHEMQPSGRMTVKESMF